MGVLLGSHWVRSAAVRDFAGGGAGCGAGVVEPVGSPPIPGEVGMGGWARPVPVGGGVSEGDGAGGGRRGRGRRNGVRRCRGREGGAGGGGERRGGLGVGGVREGRGSLTGR